MTGSGGMCKRSIGLQHLGYPSAFDHHPAIFRECMSSIKDLLAHPVVNQSRIGKGVLWKQPCLWFAYTSITGK